MKHRHVVLVVRCVSLTRMMPLHVISQHAEMCPYIGGDVGEENPTDSLVNVLNASPLSSLCFVLTNDCIDLRVEQKRTRLRVPRSRYREIRT